MKRGMPTTCMIIIILLNFDVLLSSRHRHNRAARIPCKESARTVQVVRTCPTDKQAWDERARLKGCWNVPHNCSDTQLSYHCVLDEFGHGLVEVCAIRTEILGEECAEFSPGGMFVQEHFENICKSCPFAYNSTMGYLYGECFDFAVFQFTTDGPSTHEQTDKGILDISVSTEKSSSHPTESTAFIVSMGICIPVGSVIFLVLFCRYIQLHMNNKTTKSVGETQYVKDTSDFAEVPDHPVKMHVEGDIADPSIDNTSFGIRLMFYSKETECVDDERTHMLPSGSTLHSDTLEKKTIPCSIEETPVIPLKEDLNSTQVQECQILLGNLNEEIENTTIRQSEHPDVANKTLQEQLDNKFGKAHTFPANSESLETLKECIELVQKLRSYINREKRTQIEVLPSE